MRVHFSADAGVTVDKLRASRARTGWTGRSTRPRNACGSCSWSASSGTA
jgi:hypothetical protein